MRRDWNPRPAITNWSDMEVSSTLILGRLRSRDNRREVPGDSAFLNYRPRLRDVGIERFNDIVKLLFHHAALKLHGEGKGAVVEGEIAWQQRKPLDGFELCEMRGEALNLGVNQGAGKAGLGNLFAGIERDPVFRRLGGDG